MLYMLLILKRNHKYKSMQEIFDGLVTTTGKTCMMYNSKTDDKNRNELQNVKTHWKI